MIVLRPIGRLAARAMRALVGTITTGLDGLTRLVGRASTRADAVFADRTQLLRARYARADHRQAAPLPVIDAPIDLALRGKDRGRAAA